MGYEAIAARPRHGVGGSYRSPIEETGRTDRFVNTMRRGEVRRANVGIKLRVQMKRLGGVNEAGVSGREVMDMGEGVRT